ncbi:hypothetical protein [Agrobacterium vitis]|uniref:hypothetical protein n=1 Tax=Agrobacterium vitis TaxID=373 RepID=UPI0018D21BE2
MPTNEYTPDALDLLVIESKINRLLATYVHNLDDGKITENAELLANARFQVGETVVNGCDEVARFSETTCSIIRMAHRAPGMRCRTSSSTSKVQRRHGR